MFTRTVQSGGGGGGNLEYDLLWINPSPTASFSPQTIPLDLTDYEYVVVIGKFNKASDTVTTLPRSNVIVKVDDNNVVYKALGSSHASLSGLASPRGVLAKTTGVEFTRTTDSNNEKTIPLCIFGIKTDLGDIAKYIDGTL